MCRSVLDNGKEADQSGQEGARVSIWTRLLFRRSSFVVWRLVGWQERHDSDLIQRRIPRVRK
jgi:hypothetical protein